MKALIALLLLIPALAFAHYPSVRVIDGDTVYVPLALIEAFPTGVSVRMVGINTPETRGSKCEREKTTGEAAKLFIRDAIAKATTMTVTYRKWDKYGGRVDGVIVLDGKDLGEMLITAGLAVPYAGGVRVNVWCP